MKRPHTVIIILMFVAILAVGVFLWTLKTRPSGIEVSVPPRELSLDQSLSNDTFSFHYSDDWGFAVNQEQIRVSSYIPPCDEGFDYCFYFINEKYKGTNFESAGIRINNRIDLKTENECLTTLPEGYNGLTPRVATSTNVSRSVFGPLGDAGLGHYSNGELYRLAYSGKCYEFETRIGESQFANYEPGAIREFSVGERDELVSEIRRIIDGITLPDGEPVLFPSP